jgi:hypothetical protein
MALPFVFQATSHDCALKPRLQDASPTLWQPGGRKHPPSSCGAKKEAEFSTYPGTLARIPLCDVEILLAQDDPHEQYFRRHDRPSFKRNSFPAPKRHPFCFRNGPDGGFLHKR